MSKHRSRQTLRDQARFLIALIRSLDGEIELMGDELNVYRPCVPTKKSGSIFAWSEEVDSQIEELKPYLALELARER